MTLELALIQAEKISSYISLVSQLLGIIALNEAERTELQKIKGIEDTSTEPTPAQISTLAIWLSLISNAISAQVKTIRLQQLQKEAEEGIFKQSLAPNIKITIGGYLSLIASILSVIAAEQKLQQDADIIIAAPR